MPLLLASTSHFVGIALDVAVVILLLTFACIGYHHGLIKSLLALFSTFVVFVIAVYLANDFAGLINKIYDFTSLIAKELAPSIEKIAPVYSMAFPVGMSGSQFYANYIETSSTNKVIKQFFKYALKGQSSESIEGLKVSQVLAGSIASIIMTVLAGIILFIIIKVAINLISRFFDNITRTKVFGGLNKILGFVFGSLKGLAIVSFFVLITICLSFVPKINKKIYPLIQNDTYVVKLAYNTTDAVRSLATEFILISAVLMPVHGALHCMYFIIRSGGKTLITFMFDCCFSWFVSVPLAFCLARFTEMEIIPLYLCCQCVEAVKCVIGIILIKKGVWLSNIVNAE